MATPPPAPIGAEDAANDAAPAAASAAVAAAPPSVEARALAADTAGGVAGPQPTSANAGPSQDDDLRTEIVPRGGLEIVGDDAGPPKHAAADQDLQQGEDLKTDLAKRIQRARANDGPEILRDEAGPPAHHYVDASADAATARKKKVAIAQSPASREQADNEAKRRARAVTNVVLGALDDEESCAAATANTYITRSSYSGRTTFRATLHSTFDEDRSEQKLEEDEDGDRYDGGSEDDDHDEEGSSSNGRENGIISMVGRESNVLALRVKGGYFDLLSWARGASTESDERPYVTLKCVVVPTSGKNIELVGEYKTCSTDDEEDGDEECPLLFDRASHVTADSNTAEQHGVSGAAVMNANRTNDTDPLTTSMPVIPEAFLVEDSYKDFGDNVFGSAQVDLAPASAAAGAAAMESIDIVAAEPLLPWWQQRKVLASLVCLVLVAVAISVGATLSLDRKRLPGEPNYSPGVLMPTASPTPGGVGAFAPPWLQKATSPPSVSLAPSASPTACYPVEIYFEVAGSSSNGTSTFWELWMLDGDGLASSGNATPSEVASYQSSNGTLDDGDTSSHIESMCLLEGQYEFAIRFDSEDAAAAAKALGGGMCCEGHYSVTLDGRAVVRGEDVWQQYLHVRTGFYVP